MGRSDVTAHLYSTFEQSRRRLSPSSAVPVAALVTASLVAGLLGAFAGRIAASDQPVLALLVPLALVPVLVWRHPRLGIYVLAVGAVVVEQFEYQVADRPGALTAKIPFFEGLAPDIGVSAVEILLVLVVVAAVLQAVRDRRDWVWGSPLALLVGLVVALVVAYFALGVIRGGDVRMALWEIRPYAYLAVSYFLARTLLTRPSHVRPLLWVLVLGAGFKAAYGIYLWLPVRDMDPRPESILAHEESFFFGLFAVATVGMWLFGITGRLRIVATLLLPIVLFADMANSRRTAWLILGAALLVMFVVAAVALPARRKAIMAMFAVGAIAAAVYVPAFWNASGTIAQPARAIRSQIAPDARDEASNQYREIETYNLLVRIGETRSTGLGYGIPITYSGLIDLSDSNPLIRFVPHNTVLYVWMRMGLVGMLVFTLLITQGAMLASRLGRMAKDRESSYLGALVASAVVAYAAMGLVDYGFFWFRNALMIGLLLGVTDALLRSAQERRPDVRASLDPTDPARPVALTGTAS